MNIAGRSGWYKGIAGRGAMLLILSASAISLHAADPWIKPTAEELAMTSLPGYPGAPAVILFREETTRGELHAVQHYERIKVLTEKGKDYANVELTFTNTLSETGYLGDEKDITDIAGRTIHPDGTVIPFTGKPYIKVIEKGKNFKYQARIFTLPDVEVGSIIEYRYATRIGDHVYEAPDWFIQSDIFTKSAHFVWYPTTEELSHGGNGVNTITEFSILPPGTELSNIEMRGAGPNGHTQRIYDIAMHDIPPQPSEEYMPPIRSLTYRVLFAYSPLLDASEFWKIEGKNWSKKTDSFIGPDAALKAATQTIVGDAQTQSEKLHKIYAAVMALENTEFTRKRDQKEEQAEGLNRVSNAGDVFKRGRGNNVQLTEVFVGMARAAGMKAYVMLVPDRSKHILTQGWTSFYQFDNSIAIVNVDGVEQYFDPGQRYCQYGHLAWENTFAQGLRQTDGGTAFAITPGDTYKDTKTVRFAGLNMDPQGNVTGPINMTYTGSTALRWRQRALSGDDESLKTALRTALLETLPKSLEVKVASIENLTDYEKPLVVHFDTTGSVGTATGKRMILPVDIFLAESPATFPHEKRETVVYFDYPQTVQDTVYIHFPSTMTMEASPAGAKVMFQDVGQYNFALANRADSFTAQRTYLFNSILVPVKDYGDLRTFYSQMETKDKESVVLKAPQESAGASAAN